MGQNTLLHLHAKVFVIFILLLQFAHLVLLFGFFFMAGCLVLATNFGLLCLPALVFCLELLDLKGNNLFKVAACSDDSVTEVNAKLSLDSDKGNVDCVSGL